MGPHSPPQIPRETRNWLEACQIRMAGRLLRGGLAPTQMWPTSLHFWGCTVTSDGVFNWQRVRATPPTQFAKSPDSIDRITGSPSGAWDTDQSGYRLAHDSLRERPVPVIRRRDQVQNPPDQERRSPATASVAGLLRVRAALQVG